MTLKPFKHIPFSVIFTGLLGLLLLDACQQIPLPVCQACKRDAQCLNGEQCYERFQICIPKGMCYCHDETTDGRCKSILCDKEYEGICYHPKGELAGSCIPPEKRQTCERTIDCPSPAICFKKASTNPGHCRFPYHCKLPPECTENEVSVCSTKRQGACKLGEKKCLHGVWQACISKNTAKNERCNDQDDNCDGKIDNGITCVETLTGAQAGFLDGKLSEARWNGPRAILIDNKGFLYIADRNNHRIRTIAPTGDVTTFAGTGQPGLKNGTTTTAQFNEPSGLAMDKAGNIYIADTNNHCIRKWTKKDGNISTFAGNGSAGDKDGQGTQTQFNTPIGLAIDTSTNTLYVADSKNNKIRKIDPQGNVTTYAGTGRVGRVDGSATTAQFNEPKALVVDDKGTLYIVDTDNHAIRTIDHTKLVKTLAGSEKEKRLQDGTGVREGLEGGARFASPSGIAIGTDGLLYIADTDNHSIRNMNDKGRVNTIAGNGQTGVKEGDPLQSQFRFPWGIAVDKDGHIYIADTDNNTIRKITHHEK